MFKLFRRSEKAQMQMLKDLQGNPYKFYRGKSFNNISNGRFFCSCFDIAKKYAWHYDMPIIETEIQVRNPLVIDATFEDGYSTYNYLYVYDCKLYPEEKRNSLIKYIKKVGGTNTLSTDEVLRWAMETKDIDAVIVKNVREGENSGFPIYDVMVWNTKNLVNERDVAKEKQEFEFFRDNIFKRVDLSEYISEQEQDGVVNVTKGEGYFVEHIIKRENTEGDIKHELVANTWYIEHELVVNTNVPIQIFCIDTSSYVTALQKKQGIYENTAGMTSLKEFVPYNGMIRVKKIMQKCKYQIEKT